MDEASHLRLARANDEFARSLVTRDDESSWRWCVVVAFYAAHHYTHALFARFASQLPQDRVARTARGNMLVTYVHPSHHGRSQGGTRYSIARLIDRQPRFQPLADLFVEMLEQSHAARYGLNGVLYSSFSRDDAEEAVHRLDEITSLLEGT